mmetsp:Transcript_22479/g.62717  ORF Transcript_22479/g.62717 Transcript_22479/m.62717 type:complete len:117 (+) Transcript_22479:1153-1503(+)
MGSARNHQLMQRGVPQRSLYDLQRLLRLRTHVPNTPTTAVENGSECSGENQCLATVISPLRQHPPLSCGAPGLLSRRPKMMKSDPSVATIHPAGANKNVNRVIDSFDHTLLMPEAW